MEERTKLIKNRKVKNLEYSQASELHTKIQEVLGVDVRLHLAKGELSIDTKLVIKHQEVGGFLSFKAA